MPRICAGAKTGNGQVVLIFGEPGLGKSRIAAGLTERLHAEPHLRLRYFCSPHHQDSALFPFIDQLGCAAGFARDDPPAVKLEKLEAELARAAPLDENVAFLADLLSLPGSERHPLSNLRPQRNKERTLEALIRPQPFTRPRRFRTLPTLVHDAEMAESRGRASGCVARPVCDCRAGIARRPFHRLVRIMLAA
jgi:predicted ATPase